MTCVEKHNFDVTWRINFLNSVVTTAKRKFEPGCGRVRHRSKQPVLGSTWVAEQVVLQNFFYSSLPLSEIPILQDMKAGEETQRQAFRGF